MHLTYRSLENRNEEARQLRARGYRVTVSSSRGQVLSPDYVADAKGGSPNGFGGMAPQYFARLYHIEAR